MFRLLVSLSRASFVSSKAFWGGALIVLLQAFFVYAYVSSERTIYFWDHAMYHAMARALFQALHTGQFWATLGRSYFGDYNLTFAFPSLLGFSLFGTERVVFILSNFFSWFLLYQVACGLLFMRVFQFSFARAFLAAVVVSSLQPTLWRPLLEGFPDSGACAALVLGMAFFMQEPRRWRTGIWAGLSLGLCIILRRHYVYAVFALGVVDAVFSVMGALQQKGGMAKALGQRLAFLGIATAVAVAVVCAIEYDYVVRAFKTDYATLYQSYESGAWDFFAFVAGALGALWMGAVAAGVVWVSVARSELRARVGYVVAFAVLSLALWAFIPSQASMHYLLHDVYCVGSIGLVGLGLAAAHAYQKKIKALAVVFAALAVALMGNTVWGLWDAPEGVSPQEHPDVSFFSAPRPPLVRADYDALLAVGRHLIESTTEKDHIVVVGSSFVFNQDLLRAILADKLQRPDMVRRLLFAPEIDHEQEAPFDQFAAGTVFVVPDVAQYHLEPAGQKVVTALAQFFPPRGDVAALFARDAQTFALKDGLGLSVWRRTKAWTPDLLYSHLASIRSVAGGEKSWVVVEKALDYAIQPVAVGEWRIASAFFGTQDRFSIFFAHPLRSGKYHINFGIHGSSGCEQPTITLRGMDGSGRVLFSLPLTYTDVYPIVFKSFDIAVDSALIGGYLFLDVEKQSPVPCGITLYDVAVKRI